MPPPATELDWMTAEQFRGAGFHSTAPEIDYGFRWGADHDIRLSYAPTGPDNGYLYAYNKVTDQYAVLCVDATREVVDLAWEMLPIDTIGPDGHVVMAAIVRDDHTLPEPVAVELLTHCLDRELTARAQFQQATPPARTGAAATAVISQCARHSAEELLIEAAAANHPTAEPIKARFHIDGQPAQRGVVAASGIAEAVAAAQRMQDLAERHGKRLEITTVTQGQTIIAAARVPEFAPLVANQLQTSNAYLSLGCW